MPTYAVDPINIVFLCHGFRLPCHMCSIEKVLLTSSYLLPILRKRLRMDLECRFQTSVCLHRKQVKMSEGATLILNREARRNPLSH